jgi:hypothetical protein
VPTANITIRIRAISNQRKELQKRSAINLDCVRKANGSTGQIEPECDYKNRKYLLGDGFSHGADRHARPVALLKVTDRSDFNAT